MNNDRLEDTVENPKEENSTKDTVKKFNDAGESSSHTETNTGKAFNLLNLKESVAVMWRTIDTIL